MNSEERYDKSHTFTANGGEITLNDDKTIRLNVPNGAFKQETLVKCKFEFRLLLETWTLSDLKGKHLHKKCVIIKLGFEPLVKMSVIISQK